MRAVHRDENDKVATPFGCKQRISQRFIGDSSIHRVGMPRVISAISTVIADLIRNPEGQQGDTGETSPKQPTASTPSRHCGLDPQSRGGGHATLSNYWLRPWRKLVLASRQYPQGRDSQARHHVIADLIRNPEGRRGQADNKTRQPLTVTSLRA